MKSLKSRKRPTASNNFKTEKVSKDIIDLCKSTVEPRWKRIIRLILTPIKKQQLKLIEVGIGFQWGGNISIPRSRIGDYVYVGAGSVSSGPMTIGDLTMIAARLTVVGNDHVFTNPNIPTRINFPSESRRVTLIGSDVWIGQDVTLIEGIKIGRGSIIATKSLGVSDVPPYSIYGGIPAKLIRPRFSKDEITQAEKTIYGK